MNLTFTTLLFLLCCCSIGHSQFIASKEDLANNAVINNTFSPESFQNEIDYIAGFLYTPAVRAGASCASVGTSEELYANFSGESIDRYDIVVRNGFYYHFLIDTGRHSYDNSLYSRDTYAGNHYKILGMRMDYILFYPYDFFLMNHKLQRTWISQDTVLIVIIKSESDLKRLSIELKSLNYKPRIAVLSKSSYLKVKRWMGGKDPTFNALGAHVCKLLTNSYPVALYGAFQPYEWIEDTLPLSGGNVCDRSTTRVRIEDSEWQHFLSDKSIDVKGTSFHDDLYGRIESGSVQSWKKPKGYVCPIPTTNKKYDSCAVIGAAPYLGCMQLGKDIDSHDAVYRTNLHLPQPGLEHILGSFTTHLLAQTTTFIQLLQDVGCVEKFTIHGKSMTICESESGSAALFNYGYIASQAVQLHILDIDEALAQARRAIGETASLLYDYLHAVGREGSGYKLTTGMYSVLQALQDCNSVDVYGFSVGPLHMHVHSYLMELMTLRALQTECGKDRFRLVLPDKDYESYIDAWLTSETLFFKSKYRHPMFVTDTEELMDVVSYHSSMNSVYRNMKNIHWLVNAIQQPPAMRYYSSAGSRKHNSDVAVVGTSAELYSSYKGQEIDTHSVVIRSGPEVAYTVGVDGSIDHLKYRETSSGRHFKCLGTKTNYVVIDAEDVGSIYRNLRSTLEIYGGQFVVVLRTAEDVETLATFINSTFTDYEIVSSVVNVVIPKAFAFTSKFYTSKRASEMSIGVQIAKKLLADEASTVDVYGSFMPYPPELDDITTSCSDSIREMPLTYLEWEQLRDDARTIIMEQEFHNQFLFMDYTVSRSLTALLASNSCPMNTASVTPFGSCAVVGAAPSIYCGQHGKEIDAHDAVFRTNFHLPIQEMKSVLGSKTTHIIVQVEHMAQPYVDAGCLASNKDLTMNSMHFFTVDSPYCKRSLQNHGLVIPEQGAVLLIIDPYQYANDLLKYPSKQLSKSSITHFLKSISDEGHASRLSSGMISFLYAMTHCKSVDVYGFSVGQLQMYIHSFIWELLAIRCVEVECNNHVTLHLPSDQYKRYLDTWLTSETTLFSFKKV